MEKIKHLIILTLILMTVISCNSSSEITDAEEPPINITDSPKIEEFILYASDNIGVTRDILANIDQDLLNIMASIPAGADLANLIPTVTYKGGNLTPKSREPQSFISDVLYEVRSTDISSLAATYTVSISQAAIDEKEITSFVFPSELNTGLSEDINATISNSDNTISAVLPEQANISALIPIIGFIGRSISPESGIPTDFSSVATYTVVAFDNSTREYSVDVIIETESTAQITSFELLRENNNTLTKNVFGEISTNLGEIITRFAYGNRIDDVFPQIEYIGGDISPFGNIDLTEDVEYRVRSNDFSSVVPYIVKALYDYQFENRNILAVSAGGNHSLFLDNQGSLWGSGSNSSGQLASSVSADTNINPNPIEILGNDGTQLSNISKLSSSYKSSSFAIDNNTIWAWGRNFEQIDIDTGDTSFGGQLGIGNNIDQSSMVTKVRNSSDTGNLESIIDVSPGFGFTIALEDDNTVWSWGDNHFGQLGVGDQVGTYLPVKVQNTTNNGNLSGISSISAGHDFVIALTDNDTVLAWGNNNFGQIGNTAIATSSFATLPTDVSVLSNIINIDAGGYHAIALRNDNTIWTWGSNNLGQLGQGTETNLEQTPAQILTDGATISAGQRHSLAIMNDGTLMAWGGNASGQLGIGDTQNANTPIEVRGITNVATISAGFDYSIAILEDGSVWSWGSSGSFSEGGYLANGYLNQDGSPPGSLVPRIIKHIDESTKEVLSFVLLQSNNTCLSSDIVGIITTNTVALNGLDVACSGVNIIPSIVHNGIQILPYTNEPVNTSSNATYTVKAFDGSEKEYTVEFN